VEKRSVVAEYKKAYEANADKVPFVPKFVYLNSIVGHKDEPCLKYSYSDQPELWVDLVLKGRELEPGKYRIPLGVEDDRAKFGGHVDEAAAIVRDGIDGVVNACDPSTEGMLLFEYAMEQLRTRVGLTGPTYCAWCVSGRPEDMFNALLNLMDNVEVARKMAF
jgi:hypothetical protein